MVKSEFLSNQVGGFLGRWCILKSFSRSITREVEKDFALSIDSVSKVIFSKILIVVSINVAASTIEQFFVSSVCKSFLILHNIFHK